MSTGSSDAGEGVGKGVNQVCLLYVFSTHLTRKLLLRLTVSGNCELLRKWAVNLAVMLNTKRVSSFPTALQYVVVWPSSLLQPSTRQIASLFLFAWVRLLAGAHWCNVYRPEMLLQSHSWQENRKRERAAVPIEEELFSCIFRHIIC